VKWALRPSNAKRLYMDEHEIKKALMSNVPGQCVSQCGSIPSFNKVPMGNIPGLCVTNVGIYRTWNSCCLCKHV